MSFAGLLVSFDLPLKIELFFVILGHFLTQNLRLTREFCALLVSFALLLVSFGRLLVSFGRLLVSFDLPSKLSFSS
ncbi:hypothetical protein [Peribacillus sp. Bi96]|uniref:hypothetical protein n=1 Tax=Peribacillus sp. Bi96 TaxID=2884273 RepID=UPI001E2A1FD6|nr:hypothetical protein [Peribacillus sp. Bi96]